MNTYYVGTIPVTDEIYHHGILGQKWGIRRYQNRNGTLTEEGKARYGRNVSSDEAFKNFLSEDKKTQYELARKYGTVSPKIVKKDIKSGNMDALRDDFQGVQEGLNDRYAHRGKAQNERSSTVRRNIYWSNGLFSNPKNTKEFWKDYEKNFKKLKRAMKYADAEQQEDAYKSFSRAFEDRYAGVLLKDAKYQDTSEARQWLKSQPWYWRDFGQNISWTSLYDYY